MKNKKGFTMVELLAVIAILGILSLIAVGSFTNILSKSKKQTYEELEKNMEVAAENYLIDHMDEIPTDTTSTTKINITSLIAGNYTEEISDPEVSGDKCSGYVVVRNAGNNSNLNLSYHACLKCGKYKTDDSNCK